MSSDRPVYVTPSETIALLKRHGIWLRKGLGQHFLVDNNILTNILEAADIEPDDVILEVGPGIGALTRGLADRAAHVVAVEIDERMAACFREYVTARNVTLLRMDALELTRASIEGGPIPTKVVANLPYKIAVPLVLQLLERFPELGVLVVMVQREIAERMTAAPGRKSYGGVTAKLAYYGRVRRVFTVPPTVFVPPPRVESAVVRITRVPRDAGNRDSVFSVIDAAFSQRRKKLGNALAASLIGGLEKDEIGKKLASAAIAPNARAEELSVADFERIASVLIAT